MRERQRTNNQALVPALQFNYHDDFQKYFAHPVRMLATGSVCLPVLADPRQVTTQRSAARSKSAISAGEAGRAVVPWTFADHPESEFARVRARDLQEPVVAHAGSFEVGPPCLPEEIRDKGSVGDNTATLLGRIFEQGTDPGL